MIRAAHIRAADSGPAVLAGDPSESRVRLGTVVGAICVGLLASALVGQLARSGQQTHYPRSRHHSAVRQVRRGAAVLGTSVLADSAMEHFRGSYNNHAMIAAPVTSIITTTAALAEPAGRSARNVVSLAHLLGIGVGIAGLGFHGYNVLKRPGGLSWNKLFYAAPLGAPGALAIAGTLGMAGQRIERQPEASRRHGRELSLLAGVSLLSESAEVWLLHFRGAFHNPAMYLPVTIPPVAGLLLISEALQPAHPHAFRRRSLRTLLHMVNGLGLLGTAFHVYGVSRQMGGFRNWRQNMLAGPPVPAPISFTGLGMSGLAALSLLESRRHST